MKPDPNRNDVVGAVVVLEAAVAAIAAAAAAVDGIENPGGKADFSAKIAKARYGNWPDKVIGG